MPLFRRSQAAGDAPEIFVDSLGSIRGGVLAPGGPPAGTIGSFISGRPATPEHVRAARKWFLEADASDFERLSEREVVDRATGRVLEQLVSDPLASDDPRGRAEVFWVDGDVIRFARATGDTVADRERAAAVQADQRARAEAARAKRLRRQPQTAIPLSVVYGERMAMSLREAGRRIVDAGGEIRRGPLGELTITVPQRLTDQMLTERTAWAEVGVAAEVLTFASRVVLEAVADADADTSRQPRTLLERLPDREVAFGGGVV